MKQIIGILETKGLIPAVAAVDSVLKNTHADFLGFDFIGGGVVISKFSASPISIDFVLKEAKEQAEKNNGYIASVSIDVENEILQKIFLHTKKIDANKIPEILSEKKIASPNTKNNIRSEENLFSEKNILKIKNKEHGKQSKHLNDKQIDNQPRANEKSLLNQSTTIERLKREALGIVNKKSAAQEESTDEIEQPIIAENLNVHELRHYVRSIKNFPIKGRQISRATRDELISYYKSLQRLES